MQRNFEIGSKVNQWTIISPPIKKNGKDQFILKCSCNKEKTFDSNYINRSTFSISCRTCSGKRRWEKEKIYKDGYTIKNLTVLKCEGQYKSNTIYLVRCTCGHEFRTGHTTLTRKSKVESLSYCNNCFNYDSKKPKRNSMLTKDISLTHYKRLERNAKLRGIDFNLSPEYLQKLWDDQNKKCYYTDADLFMNIRFNKKEERIKHTCSLDRIDSNSIYKEGNVCWVLKEINFMKSDISHDHFIKLCKLISIKYANPEPSFTSV